MQIERLEKNRVRIYRLTGSFDMKTSTDFKEVLFKEIEDKTFDGFVVNLGELLFIDSTAIGVLILAHRKFGKAASLRLCRLPDRIEEIFKITALDQILVIDPTEEDSLEHFSKNPT